MNSAGKLVGVLKGTPLWMMFALGAVAAAAAIYAPLRAGLPASIAVRLPQVAASLIVLALFGTAAKMLARRQAAHRARVAVDRARLEGVYAPLVALFVETHVSATTGVMAPRLKHRLSNARSELVRYRRRTIGLWRAMRALTDRQVSTSAGVDYGKEFPLPEIRRRIIANPALAGPELINFVRRADRSRCEAGSNYELLTDEEFELLKHIHAEHARLATRVSRY